MAATFAGGQYALTASAVSLTSALGLTTGVFGIQITVRNATGAANAIYLGNSDVTNTPTNAHVQIAAATDYTFASYSGHNLNTDDIFIVGTVNAANIAFINVVG